MKIVKASQNFQFQWSKSRAATQTTPIAQTLQFRGFSDRNPEQQLKHFMGITWSSGIGFQWSKSRAATQTVYWDEKGFHGEFQWSKSRAATQTRESSCTRRNRGVSVIEIASSHSNWKQLFYFYLWFRFSDRNREQPLKHFISLIGILKKGFSDRNPKQPLLQKYLKFGMPKVKS